MEAKRHKSQGNLERTGDERAGSPDKPRRVEADMAFVEETNPAKTQALMQACVAPENMRRAWKRVKANKGAPGVDGKSIGETQEHLRQHWPAIKKALLQGLYIPQAVRGVEIPKPGGGMRQLGIPTVTDRLIQQALLQVMQPILNPTFHPSSFGFRPGRSAHQAVRQAKRFVKEGRRIVVDVDLEKFFDRVNHDILMDRVAKHIEDKGVRKLIRRYLKAGMMQQGITRERAEGTPQGGPLSPLLANLLLNEVDWALEKRGLSFCRYADDCNVYVRSKTAADKVMRTMHKLIRKLKLKINSQKSATAWVGHRKFLGFTIFNYKSEAKLRVSSKAIKQFKGRIRQLTRRNCGRSPKQVVENLRPYLLGWKNYFRLAETPRVFGDLDGWIRHRIRVIYLKQWKQGKTVYRNLVARGLSPETAKSMAGNHRSYWAMTSGAGMNVTFPNAHFDALGLIRLKA